jgi:phosphohistidine swiveling domain-containing protein
MKNQKSLKNQIKSPAQSFINDLRGEKPAPAISGYSLFIFGSGYNTAKYFQDVFKTEANYSLINFRHNGQTKLFLAEGAWKQYNREVFANYLKNTKYVKMVEKKFYSHFPKINQLFEKYSYQFIEKSDNRQLLKVVEETFDLFWESNAWSHFSIYFDIETCFSLVKEAHPETKYEEIKKIWHQATALSAESFDKEQKRDILKKIAANQANKLVEDCQYFWTSYKNVLPLNEIEEKIKDTYGKFLNNPKMARAELKRMDKELSEKKKKFSLWRRKLTPIQKKIVDFCQTIMEIRDKRKNHFAKGITVTWRVAEKIFSEAGVEKDLIENVLVFEELLKGANFIKTIKADLKKREKGYIVYVPYRGAKKVFYRKVKKNYDLINNYFLAGGDKNDKEIKGQTGNKRIISGRARIIYSSKDFHLFKKGEILVTGMTRPEFVPLMRLAKAIITDEGGITCHAAIVSRELKKPCIIGTKFATKKIKDGDKLEVNANKGVVKILS